MEIPIELPANYETMDWAQRKACREQYINRQESLCYHCKTSLHSDPPESILVKWIVRRYFPTGFFDNPIHLHHSHDTGLTIGAVHAYCNAVLWQYHGE